MWVNCGPLETTTFGVNFPLQYASTEEAASQSVCRNPLGCDLQRQSWYVKQPCLAHVRSCLHLQMFRQRITNTHKKDLGHISNSPDADFVSHCLLIVHSCICGLRITNTHEGYGQIAYSPNTRGEVCRNSFSMSNLMSQKKMVLTNCGKHVY